MNLSEEDKKTIIDWLNEKCGNMRCHCCGMANWQLSPTSSITIGYDLHSTRFHYHAGTPLVALACGNCGHLLQFSTNIMGFKPDLPESHLSDSAAEEGSSGEE